MRLFAVLVSMPSCHEAEPNAMMQTTQFCDMFALPPYFHPSLYLHPCTYMHISHAALLPLVGDAFTVMLILVGRTASSCASISIMAVKA